jgi:DNA-binding response OmpR family regulator
MSAERILVVDDDESILGLMRYALAEEGYEVTTTGDGAAAEDLFAQVSPALVILDVMLPGKSGLEIARALRARSHVPIIMVSARADEVDRILGLEFGADDYVTKPFSLRELMSRVRGLIRRSAACVDETAPMQVGDLVVDVASRQVVRAGVPIHLTRTEYEIVLHLARHPGTAFSRAAILEALGETDTSGDERAIDVHVHNIREKLERDPRAPEYLLTVRGFGYRLAAA